MTSQDGMLVQEQHKGKLHVCRVWTPVVAGRDKAQAEFVLRDKGVEDRHCTLTAEFDGQLKVEDTSVAGTWINERPLAPGEPGMAGPGDTLRLGPTQVLKVLGILDSNQPKRAKGMLTLPQRIGHHVLLRVVGHGAAGVVYEAFDEQEYRRCAVKLLIAGGRAIPELVSRFKREAELQSRLRDYPGIVSIYHTGVVPESGELYAAMEYVTGNTLRDQLRAGIPRLEGVRIICRVARAVDYAHEHGLIHRDLKPSNVMVSDAHSIRLTDFGLCKALEDEDGLTATGIMLGTPSYMAPEQIEDAKRVGKEADIYAVGAMLYVVLTGRLPHSAETLDQVLEAVVKGDLTPPREVDPTIAPALSELVCEAMARDPATRPGSAMQLAKRAEAWLKQVNPPDKVTLRVPQTKRRPKRSKPE